jgi:hypothetical protein
VAEDLPQIQFPLGQQYLELLMHRFTVTELRTRAALEELKTISRARDLPGATRTALAQQRERWEAQLELIAEMRTAAVSAQQLESWLEGRIGVRAVYFDRASSNSSALLQFGG